MPEILLESAVAPGIVRLTLNRPNERNALDRALIEALAAAIAHHATHPPTRVMLIAGSGSAFCAGADLAAMRALGTVSYAENLTEARRLADLLAALHECPKPSIACVHGAAIGGGLGLVAACDVAIAAADARLRLPEVRLGLAPAVISPYVLEAIGPRQARRYALTGEMIDAERARQIGLVHEVVAPDALAAAALALADEIASGAPTALAATKALFADARRTEPSTATAERTARVLAELRAGPEAQEGLAAAIERRIPAWRR